MKKIIYLSLLALLCAACRPEENNEPEIPTPTDSVELIYDTIITYLDTFRIDTIACDTIWRDSTYSDAGNERRVVAYAAYYTNKLPDPTLVTHCCYAFAELYLSEDSVYQRFGLKGSPLYFTKFCRLKEKNPDIKLLLSFSHTVSNGNNAQHGGFSVMAASPEQRAAFAHDCVQFCRDKGLDGIDIDWEFPGLSWSGHHCNPAVDYLNFTLLMKQLRDSLGSDYLLTYAAYVNQLMTTSGGYKYIDNMAVEPYVDFINLMTYDMCSAPQPHNAYSCSGYWDIKRTLASYDKVGYPRQKLTLGIPFYGRHDYGDGEWYYHQLIWNFENNPSEWKSQFNSTFWTPVAYRNGEFWCSYDDPRSISMKANWVIDKGLGGLMYWEVSGDDDNLSLAKACWNGMKTAHLEWEEYIYQTDTIHYSDTIVTIVPKK